ncbi:MAG: DinB family protein [Bryobacteraceae bacterium]
MSVSPEVMQQHWEYKLWATSRLLDAAKQLSPDELTRDFKTADGTVIDTLAHLFWSEMIWLNRFKKIPPPPRSQKGAHDLEFLSQHRPVLHDQWRRYLAGATDATEMITYKDLKGQEWTHSLWVHSCLTL